MTIEEAKDKIHIPFLWEHFNLQGRPSKSCCSPFREDKHPSFSVSEEGKSWYDHAEGAGGDVIDFYARARGEFFLSKSEKARAFLAFADQLLNPGSASSRNASLGARKSPSERSAAKSKGDIAPSALERVLERSRAPTENECRELGLLRRLHPGAFDLAGCLGTLRVATVCAHKSWILSDATGRVADARRFDGAPYPAFGSLCERKTHSPGGSQKDWPVGLVTLRPEVNLNCRRALLVEGSGDYFAALELIALHGPGDILPIAILGAGAGKIHLQAQARLKLFKQVLIISHLDHAGAVAGEKWRALLQEVGANPILRLLHFGAPGKDLGEILSRASETQKTQFARGYLS